MRGCGIRADQALICRITSYNVCYTKLLRAEGYYTHLLDILNKEYSSISYLLIDEIPEHRALLENMMKVSNNLGVTKYRLYERSRDDEKNAEAMVLLTDSIEYYRITSYNVCYTKLLRARIPRKEPPLYIQ